MEDLENMDWEALTPLPDNTDELKNIRKNLRRRSFATVLTCFLLAAALILGTLGSERLFLHPGSNTLGIDDCNNLSLTMIAYSELFSPSQIVTGMTWEKNGFASYSLNVQMWENYVMTDCTYRTATLIRNELEFTPGFWNWESANVFARASYPVYHMSENHMQATREKLEKLPDYVQVRGRVSFPEDLTMEQLLAFRDSLEDGHIGWVGIRNAPEDRQCFPLCGMKPFIGGYVWDQVNEHYPCFDLMTEETNAENLETHFKTLLQISMDQCSAGAGIETGFNLYENYYEGVLEYVEENGVMTYGCYVVGSPQQFLDLLDSGAVSLVWLQDAWIDVG